MDTNFTMDGYGNIIQATKGNTSLSLTTAIKEVGNWIGPEDDMSVARAKQVAQRKMYEQKL
jgi:hypothetical protein